MKLKNLRKEKKLTQAKCAEYLGIPLRTYQNYENDESKSGSIKYEFIFLAIMLKEQQMIIVM